MHEHDRFYDLDKLYELRNLIFHSGIQNFISERMSVRTELGEKCYDEYCKLKNFVEAEINGILNNINKEK